MKKGQLTIFVILGLVLSSVVVLTLVFWDTITEQAAETGIIKGITMENTMTNFIKCLIFHLLT